MKKLHKKEKAWLAVAIASISVGAISIVFDIIFAVNLSYIPLLVSLVLTAHGFYGAPFYFNAWLNAKTTRKIISLLEEKGSLTVEGVSALTGLKPLFAKKHIEKHIMKKTVGYSFDGEVLKTEK